MVKLRGLATQGLREQGQVAVALEAVKARLGVKQAGRSPTADHVGGAPAGDVAAQAAHAAHEVFEGVAPALAARLREVIDALKERSDLAVLLAASNYSQAAGLVGRLYAIERGAVAEVPPHAA